MENMWKTARDLIAQGLLDKSLDFLSMQQVLSQSAKTEIIIFQARLAQLQREERTLGTQETLERNRLTKAVLDAILQWEMQPGAPSAAADPLAIIRLKRKEALQQKIVDVYSLVGQWEQKKTLSDNPTEIQRCSVEISRLQDIVAEHLKEWNTLEA